MQKSGDMGAIIIWAILVPSDRLSNLAAWSEVESRHGSERVYCLEGIGPGPQMDAKQTNQRCSDLRGCGVRGWRALCGLPGHQVLT